MPSGVYIRTEKHLKQLREQGKALPHFCGRDVSQTTRDKIRESNTGKHHSEATKKKIGNANRGKRYPQFQREKNPHWGGGRYRSTNGYIYVLQPGHPQATIKGYVAEHIVVMSISLGRPLMTGETVHHRNGIRDDNRIDNLELWMSGHPSGQRITDIKKFCIDFLEKYYPEALGIVQP